MARYVLTGAPGCGKTALLEALRARGYATVAEAASSVISAEQANGVDAPWAVPGFIDAVAAVQRLRQLAATPHGTVFFDRSPVDTLALARYAHHPTSPALTDELERIAKEQVYERQVFLVRPLGFAQWTTARRISFEDSLVFEQIHIDAYRECGYELIDVPIASIEERADLVESYITRSL